MNDTIAAIASGMTASGIGIVRISGPEAFDVIAKIFKPKNKRPVSEWKTNTIHYGYIVRDGKNVDECLVMAMRGPHTYTTEDTIEIDCHGGLYVMQSVLETVLSVGVRAAEPGEFTRRAFEGGRIDLSEAEAVMDIIDSTNKNALKSSLMQLGGSVKNEISALRELIMNELAFIEAALDDPEHMNLDGYPEELSRNLVPIENRLTALLRSFNEGRIIREGIMTVILGKPNAGKSSLLNVLTGEDRAIVTDIEGTTRDTLEESVTVGGITLRLIDTAGIRDTKDKIEQIGVGRAKESAQNADLILCVFDLARPLDENDYEILDMIKGRRAIVILNKNDLKTVASVESIQNMTDAPCVFISARERSGIDELADTIRTMFFTSSASFNEEVMITNVRHKQACEKALNSIALVRNSIDTGMPEDFFSIDLMDAYSSLGTIIGQEVDDDLVDAIFSKFCMGK